MEKRTELEIKKPELEWIEKDFPDETRVIELSGKLNGLHPVLCSILIQRGITNLEEAEHFFRPKLEDLEDPLKMKDMDRAVSRIIKSLDRNKRITVLGDYDVDGTTSAALMYLFLKNLGVECAYYIPDRYEEGYGISLKSIDRAVESGSDLMICLDCGIKAIDKVAYANEKGLDIVICDHHTPGTKLPDAVAVLDPKRVDCPYPFKELSGCGVGFKLIQALTLALGRNMEEAYRLLDLVAVSIAADIVPVIGENRCLSYFGIRKVNMDPLTGIQALKVATGLKSQFNNSDLVFKLAPRINAAGRMETGMKAVEILVAEDAVKARELATAVNAINLERGETDRRMTEEAIEMIGSDPDDAGRMSTVLHHSSWHKGVIGIVASRMIEKFYRPTIIFCGDGEILSGSARSVRHFDIYGALESCSDLLMQFGGHKFAAGMTMKRENFVPFRKRFEGAVRNTIQPESLVPAVIIDADLNISEVTRDFYKVLKRFAPFGPGNMNPVFQSKHAVVVAISKVGKTEDHLRLQLCGPDDPMNRISSIGFNLGHLADEISEGQMIQIVYTIEENSWNGKVSLQLNIKDIKT
ncbi:MAG: single-stranded-DNA-specific exonuclease RecJ [Vicingaceae bacterium]